MAGKSRLIIGSRGSDLALWQAEHVRRELRRHWPDLEIEIRVIRTKGDRITDTPLARIGGRGLFVKELERALRLGRIDLAVHSLKDVPTTTAPGLVLAAITRRADPRDVLVCPEGQVLASLPPGARLGTSSLRRQAQLRHYRPDLVVEDLRGNLPTRLAKMAERGLDGIVVAACGLQRLGLTGRISQYLPYDVCLPAVGQGAMAVEVREEDQETFDLVRPLHHAATATAVAAERAFLAALQGGCQVPVAAYACLEGGRLRLQGLVARPDGSRVVRGERKGRAEEAEDLGRVLAEDLLRAGAAEILQAYRL
ncbi:MAG: hydroxymethylbilane synthase [Moorellales bacterium]